MKPSSLSLLLLATCISGYWCFPGGPPINTAVCDQLYPQGHGALEDQQQGNGGFLIATNLTLNENGTGFNYIGGERYSVFIFGTTQTFRGFLIQARSLPGNMLIGSFEVTDSTTMQILNCADNTLGVATEATAAHRNPNREDRTSAFLTWMAPPGMNGTVNLTYTIVATFRVYHIALSAADNLFQPVTPPPPEQPTNLSAAVVAPSLNSSEYRLVFRSPVGCVMPNCDQVVAIDNNAGDPNYLDFYISGRTPSWAAVGFSLTRSMFISDVLGCYVNETSGLVEAVDTWNVVNNRTNELDTVQDTVLFNSSNVNGVITCTFVRSIDGTVVGNEDRFLNQSLFMMYGTGNVTGGELNFLIHGLNNVPTLLVQQFNPTVDSNADIIVETPREPEDYRLTLRNPPGCNVSECNIFVGIDTNNSTAEFLDIYMEADAEAWVAVGFTNSRNMFASDVVACNYNPDLGMIEALDTWNEVNGRVNTPDTSQDVILFRSNLTNGRINCTVAKRIMANLNVNVSILTPEDLDLDTPLWINYAYREQGSIPGRLQGHVPANRFITDLRVNAVTDNQTALQAVAPGALPDNVANSTLDPLAFRVRIQDPQPCDPSNCDIYVGIDTNTGNSTYLDFYLQGASDGWIAIGFSDTQNMFDADVLGCNVNPNTGLVEGVDTWNPPANQRNNIADNTNDVILLYGIVQDGRITCRFTRTEAGSDPGRDFNLTDTDFFLMYGNLEGGSPISGSLSTHTGGRNPRLSGARVNVAENVGEVAVDNTRRQLTQAHGILMLIAWPLMAVIAIFFAAWMRPALPNGEWFQVHRALMLGSILVASVGFALIFIANRNGDPPGLITLGSANPVGTAHLAIGYLVMFLHLLNPFIAICRCKPNDKNRWIFNIIHGTAVGMFAEILALTNCGIGLAIFSRNLSRFLDLTILWVYLGYLGFFLAVILILFLLYTIIAYTSSENDRGKLAPSLVKPLVDNGSDSNPRKVDQGIELNVAGSSPGADSGDEPKKPKTPSRDSPIRWMALAIFATVVIIFTVVLIILVAV